MRFIVEKHLSAGLHDNPSEKDMEGETIIRDKITDLIFAMKIQTESRPESVFTLIKNCEEDWITLREIFSRGSMDLNSHKAIINGDIIEDNMRSNYNIKLMS